MSFYSLFALTTIPAGISITFLLINRKMIDSTLIKCNEDYKMKHNIYNIVSLIKVHRNCRKLSKEERILIITSIWCVMIGYFTVTIWAVIILLFPDQLLG